MNWTQSRELIYTLPVENDVVWKLYYHPAEKCWHLSVRLLPDANFLRCGSIKEPLPPLTPETKKLLFAKAGDLMENPHTPKVPTKTLWVLESEGYVVKQRECSNNDNNIWSFECSYNFGERTYVTIGKTAFETREEAYDAAIKYQQERINTIQNIIDHLKMEKEKV